MESSTNPTPYFVKDGEPFCFSGTNNYYLSYKSRGMVSDVLDAAAHLQLKVVRLWAFIDRGSLESTRRPGESPAKRDVHPPGHHDGVFFQYWDDAKGAPAYRDGPEGLEHLDFVLHAARERGLLVTLVLTNNWREFGGMDQYLAWYDLSGHHLFYSDDRVRRAFKDWIFHLVTRRNHIDGVLYAEDPAIFAWELANEPRAQNGHDDRAARSWDDATITTWAAEMSAYVKSLDRNHMVAVGDEGFYPGPKDHWAYRAHLGVDSRALMTLPAVDFGTYHLYPDHWDVGPAWARSWIEDHIALSREVGKPIVLEEYGLRARRSADTGLTSGRTARSRLAAYENWSELVLRRGGQASMFWMLAGRTEDKTLYPDYDHFTIYETDPIAELLGHSAAQMSTNAAACALAPKTDPKTPSPFVQARSNVSLAGKPLDGGGLPRLLAGSEATRK